MPGRILRCETIWSLLPRASIHSLDELLGVLAVVFVGSVDEVAAREKKVSRRVVESSFMPKCEDQELQVEMLLRQRDTLTKALGERMRCQLRAVFGLGGGKG
jgi:hypothetical protein